jgi:hypothetical protein
MPILRTYEVSVKDDYEGKYTQRINALSAGKAKYDYWLDARDAWPDFQWSQLRCRSLGPFFTIRPPQSEDVRRKLEILRHALGLDDLGLDKQGGTTGHRNYYALYTTSDGFDLCMGMCASTGSQFMPLMGHRKVDALAKDMVYFHVTIGGMDFLKRHLGVDHTQMPLPV